MDCIELRVSVVFTFCQDGKQKSWRLRKKKKWTTNNYLRCGHCLSLTFVCKLVCFGLPMVVFWTEWLATFLLVNPRSFQAFPSIYQILLLPSGLAENHTVEVISNFQKEWKIICLRFNCTMFLKMYRECFFPSFSSSLGAFDLFPSPFFTNYFHFCCYNLSWYFELWIIQNIKG